MRSSSTSVQTLAVVFALQIFACLGQNLQPGSTGSSRDGIVCSPQNHITVEVPICPANQTILGIVGKLERLEAATLDMQETLTELSRSLPEPGARTGPQDCYDVLQAGYSTSGTYIIQPDDDLDPFRVYCDMQTDNGGWTVFQRRSDGSMNFFRSWESYKNGFGNVNAEFWLGNDKLFRLTNQRRYQLRIDMADMDNNQVFALYGYFRIGDEFSDYKLIVEQYSGTSGDSLSGHSNAPFSTTDRDNDYSSGSCATAYKGAWWYTDCHNANLNGPYLKGEHTTYADGVNWSAWKGYNYSLKATEMKIRPVL